MHDASVSDLDSLDRDALLAIYLAQQEKLTSLISAQDEELRRLEAELESHRQALSEQRQALSEQSEELHSRSERIEHLKLMVAKLRHVIFGAKSEKIRIELEQLDVQHPRIAKYLELCMRIQDLPRHLGQHSGGMVICQGQLDRVVPLERASMAGRTVVQWDKEDCANLGIIKVDLLGLGMMAVLKDCLTLVPEHYGEQLDLAQLPEDEEVYRTLQRADTIGTFQVESPAQQSSLPKNRPEKFYDVVVQVAIIRPGPIVGKMMHPYMRRRQKLEEVTYPHPSLESTLKRTLGVPLFQEQLLRMAMVVANFTGSEAEELRRAVGMRRSWERMKNLEGRLREGMTANGLDPTTQETIIQNISSFALYGFPESHAASFALIAYASVYIKVKYLAAFTCALLNNQPMGFYSPAIIIEDARRHGLRVKPIDVQVSDWPCTIEHEADQTLSLRLGLGYVRGLRSQCALAIVRGRSSGRFASVDDLVLRVPQLNRKELALLANVGALNSLSGMEHRRDALWQVERAGKLEGPLIMQHSQWLLEEESVSPLESMTAEERLVADYAVSSVTTGPHPMWFRRKELNRRGYLRAADLESRPDGSWVKTAGLAFAKQRPGTASGVVFVGVADETGTFRIFIASDFFEQNRRVIQQAKFIGVEGPIQKEGPIIHVMARSLYELSAESPAGRLKVTSHDFH